MIHLNDLVLDSDTSLINKIRALSAPPFYLADGLADYLDEVSHIPRPSLLREITLTLLVDISYSVHPYVYIEIPLVSISPSPDYHLHRAVLLEGDSRTTTMFWKNNSVFSKCMWEIVHREFEEGWQEAAAKTYTVALQVYEEDGARVPYILAVYSDPINPNNLKRLKKEPSRHLLPGYALG